MKSHQSNASPRTTAIVQPTAAQFYDRFVADIKQRIRTAQIKTALAANAELVLHYWEIGRAILTSQKREGWGTKVIDRLAYDLQREFPRLAGYSARNLKYMRAFAAAWPDRAIMHQLGAQIPWKHNCVLLDRAKDPAIRECYIRKTVEHGWSRSVLMHQLDTKLHRRIGQAPTNFALILPPPQSDLAREMIKDPFIFKPAPLDESARERALEEALLARLKDFLIELGAGFAFVGNQYRLEVAGEEFFLDLLFYHTRLHCYIVVDLKVVDCIIEGAPMPTPKSNLSSSPPSGYSRSLAGSWPGLRPMPAWPANRRTRGCSVGKPKARDFDGAALSQRNSP